MYGRARKILANAHTRGDENAELIRVEFDEIQQTIRLEQELEGNGWLELIKTRGNRHRLAILICLGTFSQLSGNALGSYYVHDVLDQAGIKSQKLQLEINGILNIWNAVSAIFACFWVDKLGRRPMFLASTLGMLISYVVWTICAAELAETGSQAFGISEISFIFVFYGCYNTAWSGMLVGYGVEILPYRIRAKVSILGNFCRRE